MARFRKKRSRSSGRGFFRARRSGSKSTNPLKVVVPAVAYGAARQFIAQAAEPITSKIPLGNYADEALFGAAGYFMAKKGSGIVKDIGLAVLTVEAAAIGHQFVSGMNGSGNSGSW